jgi:predicted secreted protein
MSNAFAGRGSHLLLGNGAPTEVFTAVAELKKISRGGSKADLADVTNMDSGVYREYLPTLLAAGEISFDGNYLPDNTTQENLQTVFDTQALHNYEITLPAAGTFVTTLGTWKFAAYLTALDQPELSVDKEATFSGKLTITGKPTFTVGS